MNSLHHRSGLSEDQLLSLWKQVREKWPVCYRGLLDERGEWQREEVGFDGGVHSVIQEAFPDLPIYPDRTHIYWDMKRFSPSQLRSLVGD
jgi:hypothetical protein